MVPRALAAPCPIGGAFTGGSEVLVHQRRRASTSEGRASDGRERRQLVPRRGRMGAWLPLT